jgi:hypothetical protein
MFTIFSKSFIFFIYYIFSVDYLLKLIGFKELELEKGANNSFEAGNLTIKL